MAGQKILFFSWQAYGLFLNSRQTYGLLLKAFANLELPKTFVSELETANL